MSSSVLSLLSPAAFCLRSASLPPNIAAQLKVVRVSLGLFLTSNNHVMICVCVCVYMPRGTLSVNLSSTRVTFPFNDVLLSGMLLKNGIFH